MTQELCYKLVERLPDGRLMSFNAPAHSENEDAGICIEYVPGKWTTPKLEGSGLFVFKDLEPLIDWYNSFGWDVRDVKRLEIWVGSTVGLRKHGRIANIATPLTIQRFWNNQYDNDYYWRDAPKGTYVCDKLRLDYQKTLYYNIDKERTI